MAGDTSGVPAILVNRITHGWREETTYRTDPDAVAGGDATATQIGGFSGTLSVMTQHATSAYTGSGDRVYTFTVSGAGTVGTTVGLKLYYDDGIGHADLVTGVAIGSTYTPGDALTIAEGVKVTMTAAAIEAASAWRMDFTDNAILNTAVGDAGAITQIGGTSATTTVMTEDATSSFTPAVSRVYLFTVSGAGTVGTTAVLNLLWDDQNGNTGSVDIGSGYTPSAILTIGAEGVVMEMTAGDVEVESEWSAEYGSLHNEWFGPVINVNFPFPITGFLEEWVQGQGRERYILAPGERKMGGSIPSKCQDFRLAVFALGKITTTEGDGAITDPFGTVIPVGYYRHEIEVTYDLPSFVWDMEIQYGASPTRKIARALGNEINTWKLSGSISALVESEYGIMTGHFNDVGIGSSEMAYSPTSPSALRSRTPYVMGHSEFYLGIDRTGAAIAPLALSKVNSFDYTLSNNLEEGRYGDGDCSSANPQEMLPGNAVHDLTLNITASGDRFWKIAKIYGADNTSSGYPSNQIYSKALIKLNRSTLDYAVIEYENCGINCPWNVPATGKVTLPLTLKPESIKITEVNAYPAAYYPTGL